METQAFDLMIHAHQIGLTLVYVAIGMFVMAVGFVCLDKLTPYSLHKELADDQNPAIGIVVGSMMIGLSIIIASAMH